MRDTLSRVLAAVALAGALALGAGPAGAAEMKRAFDRLVTEKVHPAAECSSCGPSHLARVQTRALDA